MSGVGLVLLSIMLAVSFGLGNVVNAGSACVAGISDCTSVLRRQTSAVSNVNEICRFMEDYLTCIKRMCSASLSACDIQTAGNKFFKHLDNNGYVCSHLSDWSRFLDASKVEGSVACPDATSSRHTSPSSSASLTSLSLFELSSPLSIVVRLLLVMLMSTFVRYFLS